jgi:hypothetical protein
MTGGVIALALASCGSDVAVDSPSDDPITIALGFESDGDVDEFIAATDTVVERSVRHCLEQRGFDYVAAPELPPQYFSEVFSGDVERAASSGFGIADTFAFLAETEAGNDPRSLAQAQCEESANQELAGQFAPIQAASKLVGEIAGRVNSDPATLDLDQAWSACMSERGQTFSSIAQVEAEVGQGALARDDEVTLAVDTANCVAGQVDDRREIRNRIAAEILGENQQIVDDARAAAKDVLLQAAESAP